MLLDGPCEIDVAHSTIVRVTNLSLGLRACRALTNELAWLTELHRCQASLLLAGACSSSEWRCYRPELVRGGGLLILAQ